MEKAKSRGSGTERTFTTIPDDLLEKQGLTLNAKVILGKILNLWKGCKQVTITNKRLSQLICSDERTVQRAKSELTKLGLISVHQETKGRGNLATIQVDEKAVNRFLGYQYFKEKPAVSKDKSQPKGEGLWKYGRDKVIG